MQKVTMKVQRRSQEELLVVSWGVETKLGVQNYGGPMVREAKILEIS